jgi:cell wall-associated protease
MKILLLLLITFLQLAHANTYIVEMKKTLSQSEINSILSRGGIIELFDSAPTEYFRRTYKISNIDEQIIKTLLPVATFEKITKASFFGIKPQANTQKLKNDSLSTLQWNLHNQEQVLTKLFDSTKLNQIKGTFSSDINWKNGIEKLENGLKRNPIVAVVDMGIDLNHPEFENQLYKNMQECDKNGNISDLNEDKDNNGLKGDCVGWNFAAQDMNSARRPFDDNGHGTHVAGIISAKSNQQGITGISDKIKILPIKVTGSIDETPARGEIQPLTDRIAKGILYAAKMKVDVINLSLGWTRAMDTKYLRESLDFATAQGITIVAAAGNNNNNAAILPCAHYDIICVGAITANGEITSFSNFGGEVDVLAPGDEIISTIPWQKIPLQLNLQGYDILSGTSQATPHVSALAALLRANFPEASLNEINRKIIDSSKPSPNPLKSTNGLIDLKNAFEIADAPSVRPIFKNASLLVFDYNEKKLKYLLPIKNFGSNASNVQIKVNSLSTGVSINQEFVYEKITSNQISHLKIDGLINSLLTHNLVQLEVQVLINNIEVKKHYHQFRLGHDFLKSSLFQSKKFKFTAGNLPVGIIKEGQATNLIQTVEVLFKEDSLEQEFYLHRRIKDKNQFEIKIFRHTDEFIEEVNNAIVIDNVVDLLNLYRIDLNGDGEDDYLVRTLNCSEMCDDRSKAKRYIQYSYFNKELNPLFAEKSFWKFLPTLVNVHFPSQRFHYINHPDFGKVAVPYFIETTIIPRDQQKLAPFELYDNSIASRLLRLYPKVLPDGVNFETEIVSTKAFLDEIRNKFNLNAKTPIQVLKNSSLNKENFKNGHLNILLSTGEGVWGQNILVTIKENKISGIDVLANTHTLWGFEQYTAMSLENNSINDNFVGLHSNHSLQTIFLGKTFTVDGAYSSLENNEPAISHVASYFDSNTSYTFFQTPSRVVLLESNKDQTNQYYEKINRFSFLPGYIFSDTFYPIKAKINSKIVPALYVDETDIQNFLLSLTVFHDKKISNPIALSLFVPPICKSLNPNLSADYHYNLSILCLIKNQWELLSIPLNI